MAGGGAGRRRWMGRSGGSPAHGGGEEGDPSEREARVALRRRALDITDGGAPGAAEHIAAARSAAQRGRVNTNGAAPLPSGKDSRPLFTPSGKDSRPLFFAPDPSRPFSSRAFCSLAAAE